MHFKLCAYTLTLGTKMLASIDNNMDHLRSNSSITVINLPRLQRKLTLMATILPRRLLHIRPSGGCQSLVPNNDWKQWFWTITWKLFTPSNSNLVRWLILWVFRNCYIMGLISPMPSVWLQKIWMNTNVSHHYLINKCRNPVENVYISCVDNQWLFDFGPSCCTILALWWPSLYFPRRQSHMGK